MNKTPQQVQFHVLGTIWYDVRVKMLLIILDERIRETKLSERAPSGDAYPWKAEIVHFKKLELAQF